VVLAAVALVSLGGAPTAGAVPQPEVAAPAVIALDDGRMEVFVRGANNELVQRSWDGSTWSGWKNLGGDLTAAPAVTSSRPGRLDVFVRGERGDLVHRIFEGGQWSGWINLGGELTSAPAAISPSPGRIDVFVRGRRGELVQRTQTNGTWGGWVNHGDYLLSGPAAVAVGPGQFDVFARRSNLRLVQRSFRGSSWSASQSLGGDLTAAPSAAMTGPDRLHVLVRGMNGELVHRIRTGSSWGGWMNLGGTLSSSPAVASPGPGRLEVFVRGAGDDLVQRSYNGGRWSGWKNLGGQLRGRLQASLRVLTHNVYGLKESWCAIRGKELGWRVANAQPAYDIVGLQEHYSTPDFDFKSCDAGPLTNAIWSTGRYRNPDNYYRHYPEVSGKPDGGISLFTLHQVTKFEDWRWSNDGQGGLKAAEGFVFARIRVPNTGVTVDLYLVHLNSGKYNVARRRLQLQQLRDAIMKYSRGSGNPVLVIGDFNIGGPPSNNGNAGYDDIRRVLREPDDLWISARPRDDGYTIDCVANNIEECDDRERIDYMFVPSDPELTSSRYLVRLSRTNDIRVVNWRVQRQRLSNVDLALGGAKAIGLNVSDHLGVDATIEIRER
jgi:endonuclease/exonuclease/phosphatase family metal-dependent hydrolase